MLSTIVISALLAAGASAPALRSTLPELASTEQLSELWVEPGPLQVAA